MMIDANTVVSVSEVNQCLSHVTRITDKNGQAAIIKNDKPKYHQDMDSSPVMDLTDDEKIDAVAAQILKRYKSAFLELAK